MDYVEFKENVLVYFRSPYKGAPAHSIEWVLKRDSVIGACLARPENDPEYIIVTIANGSSVDIQTLDRQAIMQALVNWMGGLLPDQQRYTAQEECQ